MKRSYVYHWFDSLIYEQTDRQLIPAEIEGLSVQLREEKRRIQQEIRDQVFQLKEETHSRHLINMHYNLLVPVLDRVSDMRLQNNGHSKANGGGLQLVESALTDILVFLENEFPNYLVKEIQVPLIRLIPVRQEVSGKMGALIKKLDNAGINKEPARIIKEFLEGFLARIDARNSITLHELEYTLAIVEDIERMNTKMSSNDCEQLHELLIYWNLNTQATVDYFLAGKDQFLAGCETVEQKLEFYRYELMKLKQIPEKPGFVYDRKYPSLKSYFTKYILQEIQYLEKKEVEFAPIKTAKKGYEPLKQKVHVAVSADQIALLLRAADDVRLLLSKSMRAIFHAVVPYLSTPSKHDLSPDNTRSKAYAAEVNDKKIVIDFLQAMIERIQAY